MSGCRCKTINLAVMSVDSLKKMEGCIKNQPQGRTKGKECYGYEKMPPPPGPVSVKKIMVCSPRPVEYHCHPLPCVCPPCPPCETYSQMIWRYLKTGAKLFVFYSFIKWTADQKLWNGHYGTAKFTLEIIEKNFPPATGTVSLPNLQLFKYHILNTWDKAIAGLFYYIIALPLKALSTSSPSHSNEKMKNAVKVDECCKM